MTSGCIGRREILFLQDLVLLVTYLCLSFHNWSLTGLYFERIFPYLISPMLLFYINHEILHTKS